MRTIFQHFSPVSCNFIYLKSKYLQHRFVEPQTMSFRNMTDQFFTHTTGKIAVLQQYTETFLNLITLDCTTVGPLRLTAVSVATTSVPFYQESGSTSFSSMHFSYYYIL